MNDKLTNAISTFIGKLNELNQSFETSINDSIEIQIKENKKLQEKLAFEQLSLENKENLHIS